MSQSWFAVGRRSLWIGLLLVGGASHGLPLAAETFTGTNPPGGEKAFTFSLATGVTNLSLVVTNTTTAFSYLYLKQGDEVTSTNFDHAARLSPGRNAINLELPDFVAGTHYALLVRTPTNSASHTFTVTLTTNRTDLRSSAFPVTKPVVFTLSGGLDAGVTNVFQVDVPTNLTGWRVVLAATGSADPDLYVRRGALATTTTYTKKSTDRPVDTAFLDATEATAQTYFISVVIPKTDVGNATYTLGTELSSLVTLAWDPGNEEAGTLIYTNQSTLGGDYFLRVDTRTTASGVWRTRLNVLSQEADLFLRRRSLPSVSSWDAASGRTGSDGVALAETAQFTADQEWFVMVYAAPGARWTLFTGNAFVAPLPSPGTDDRGGTNLVVAPEGMNFYRTTLGGDILAWRLGLNGATNTVLVRRTKAAHPYSSSTHDWQGPGQMLLVPSYLKPLEEYFVTVTGLAGQALTLDSRNQAVQELAFGAQASIVATNYGYATFRVPVPARQIAWELELTTTSGQADLAVREAGVPNEFQNTAFVEGTNTVDTLTLVPPTLTDGSFYITVYGPTPYLATLVNRHPPITDLPMNFRVVNDLPASTAWRYYRLPNIEEQVGILGWEAFLEAQFPGTEIAVRRNAAPGRWDWRTNNTTSVKSGVRESMDGSSTNGFIQRPRQPADIWYIGVHHPTEPLGPFVLSGRVIPTPRVAITPEFTTTSIANQEPERFQFFKLVVSNEIFGLDLRLARVTSGDPRIVVCREMLPVDLRTIRLNGTTWTPYTSTNWPSGAQIAPTTDWTGYTTSATGANESGRFFFTGQGNPMEPGNYYVGILSGTGAARTNAMTYDLLVRGLERPASFTELAYEGGTLTQSNLAPHEVAWARVIVPSNAPTWQVRLDTVRGDGFLALRYEGLPNYGAASGSPASIPGRLVQETGTEHFLLLPTLPETVVAPGTYYLALVSDGEGPSGNKSGTNTSTLSLTSLGPLQLPELGTVDPTGRTALAAAVDQLGGEIRGFRFIVPAHTPAIELRTLSVTGKPRLVVREDLQPPRPKGTYGVYGGWPASWSDDATGLIRIPNPPAGTYTLLVETVGKAAASYTLQIIGVPPLLVDFDGGFQVVTNHPGDSWRYYQVQVPDDPRLLGWDLRLTNVVSGDPILVICREQTPEDLTTHTSLGLPWKPYSSTEWPAGWQFAPDTDWTGYDASPTGQKESGRIFAAGIGNPVEPGTYIIGIANRTVTASTNLLSYTIVSRGVGEGRVIPVEPLDYQGGSASIPGLLARDAAYFKLEVPTNAPSWQLRLGTNVGDGLLLVRKDGLPNPGAVATTSGGPTNLGGVKIQKIGPEHFALLPTDGNDIIQGGTYYLAAVSEGQTPAPPQRIGSATSSLTLQSIGALLPTELGAIDPVTGAGVFAMGTLEGGQMAAYQFEVPDGTLGFVVSLANRIGNPCLTLRADLNLSRSFDTYGRVGGWTETWKSTNVVSLSRPPAGTYTVMVQACPVSKTYPDATYLLLVDPLMPGSLPFDGGCARVTAQPPGAWSFFAVDVPSEATGWDVRLSDVTSGDPRLVICRHGYPVNVSSRTASGGTWNWGTARTWPEGNQAAPGLDWTGLAANWDFSSQTGRVFVAGMGNPIEAGRYIVGVSNGTGGTNSTAPMSYTVCSRGIGEGYLIPVTRLDGGSEVTVTNTLAPREAAYYRVDLPEGISEWKLHVAPTAGDVLLLAQKDYLPSIQGATNVSVATAAGGRKFQKPGDEHAFVSVLKTGATNLAAGTYYLAVVSEGADPDWTTRRVGAAESTATLTSYLPSALVDLGALNHLRGDVVRQQTQEGGETIGFGFYLEPGAQSLELSLLWAIGNPVMRLAGGTVVPVDSKNYGQDGVLKAAWENTNRIVVLSPTTGYYRLSVLAQPADGDYLPANYTLRIHAQSPPQRLSFDAGTVSVLEQPPDVWRFFQVVVPTNAVGWDLRLTDVTAGNPRLVIARDTLPKDLKTTGEMFTLTNWPSGNQIAPELDWTGYNATNGVSATGQVFQVGMGNPLEAGNYFVGITNVNTTVPASYTLVSRGIGANFSIRVIDLPFTNGFSTQPTLAPREAAWYRVVVPSNQVAWKVAVNPTLGDALLVAQKDYLPSIGAATNKSVTKAAGGKKLQKLDREHLYLLSAGTKGATNVPAGTYYLGVVSEGIGPDRGNRWIGTNNSTVEIFSEGGVRPSHLGIVGSDPLVAQGTLQGGEIKTWVFALSPNLSAVEAVMTETNGVPRMAGLPGTYPPATTDPYGQDGGSPPAWESLRVITIPNPRDAEYSLTVQASAQGDTYPDARYRIQIQPVPVLPLNFDRQLNGNGLSHTHSNTLNDGHRAYYRVVIPAHLGQTDIIGWRLNLAAQHGFPTLRVRKDLLPEDGVTTGTSDYFPREAVLVPQYLSPGTWYVEVKADGLCQYTLTSATLTLTRAPWSMPARGEPVATPGLPAQGAQFADTGLNPDGSPVSGLEGGVDLEQDNLHYYAVIVPPNNLGLLRSQLDAISGNPNLYLRVHAPPTLSHAATGRGGLLCDRALTSASGTEYGNWVPIDGRAETGLTPGIWYLAVHAAGGSNVRYRLRLSVGNITDLDFAAGSLTSQSLVAGDWRYYRVAVPVTLNEPWTVTFDRQIGEVVLHVRDVVPPGQGTNATDFIDWSDDYKNQGPYSAFAQPGAIELPVPPLRPGQTYYLGFRATRDSTFSVGSRPGARPVPVDAVVAFAGGNYSTQIPAYGAARVRVDVPADGRRWIHYSTHSSSIKVYLEQGTTPTVTASDHWRSAGVNSALNVALYEGTWPWAAGHSYYLTATNLAATTQSFAIQFDGRGCDNDDYDADGLPDCWETAWFGSIYTYGPDSDPDGDGLTNAQEMACRCDPTTPTTPPTTSAQLEPIAYAAGQFTVAVHGEAGQVYRVQASTSLTPGSWSDVGTVLLSSPVQSLQLTLPPNAACYFLRVVTP